MAERPKSWAELGKGRFKRLTDKILIKGGRVIDPTSEEDSVRDICVEKNVIVEKFSNDKSISVIDAKGLLVTPGLIDMHVHLREPGREDEETIESGAQAACAGGFTTIVCMPNTDPRVETRSVVEYITKRATGLPSKVKVVGAISVGSTGESLTEMGAMIGAGAVAFSDDGRPVKDSALMRRALEYSTVFDVPIISHAEDMALSDGGVMHEGLVSTSLGLKGIPAAAEDIIVARDIILSKLTGAKLHVTHLSTAGSVELVRAAKKEGLKVTADVTPHHLSLTADGLKGYEANCKVNPPLREEADRKALIAGLVDGTIDAIASDHAPHAANEKEEEIERAPFGTIGLQTTLPIVLTQLISSKFSLLELMGKLTKGPAQILGIDEGTLQPGSEADISIIDTEAKVQIEPSFFLSKSKNSAFLGMKASGRAVYVILRGRLVLKEGELVG